MRCLTLAEALRSRGADIRFITRAHAGNLIELLQQRAIAVAALPAPERATQASDGENYVDWLGVTQEEDAEQTIRSLQGFRPHWLIVDHYGLDASWERRLRAHAARIMVIDDIANRPHDCDLLLDQNYSDNARQRYEELVGAECRLLLGPRYALLRPEYAHHRRAVRADDGQIRRAFIFFGGSDPLNMTGMTLAALSASEFDHIEVDVVVGTNNRHRQTLEAAVAARPRTTLHGPRAHLADLMAAADVGIGAGGVTTWERMCLGLPSLVISIAANQKPACDALSRLGLVRYLGDAADVRTLDVIGALRKWLVDPSPLHQLSLGGQLMVDGLGAMRLSEGLDPGSVDTLRLRPADDNDAGLYFSWVNDLEVRQQAIRSEPISWAEHARWFGGKLADDGSHLYVLQAGELPVGQIRFDRDGVQLRIDYSIDPLFRGRGWARHLVGMGVARLQSLENVVFRAEVKQANLRSAAVFSHLGFVEAASSASSSLRVFLFDPSTHHLSTTAGRLCV